MRAQKDKLREVHIAKPLETDTHKLSDGSRVLLIDVFEAAAHGYSLDEIAEILEIPSSTLTNDKALNRVFKRGLSAYKEEIRLKVYDRAILKNDTKILMDLHKDTVVNTESELSPIERLLIDDNDESTNKG